MDWVASQASVVRIRELVRGGADDAGRQVERLDGALARLQTVRELSCLPAPLTIPRKQAAPPQAPAGPPDSTPARPASGEDRRERRASMRDSPLGDLFKATDNRRDRAP